MVETEISYKYTQKRIMVETEINSFLYSMIFLFLPFIEYKNELWQKQKYHTIQRRIMVETEISQNTKTNYGRTRNIIQIQTRIMVEPEINSFLYSMIFLFLP